MNGLTVHCCRCGQQLSEPGALVFSPPMGAGLVVKYHVCADCWPAVAVAIERGAGSGVNPTDNQSDGPRPGPTPGGTVETVEGSSTQPGRFDNRAPSELPDDRA